MAKIKWDQTGERDYEYGVKNGVLYVMGDNGVYETGVAWNGLVKVGENPSGGEASPFYADGIKYANLMSAEEFGATIDCFTTPKEFERCDGIAEIAPGVYAGQQKRSTFAFCYRTEMGDDTNNEKGYKLHVIYGCLAAPTQKDYNTVNESPELITFSYTITTTPVEMTDLSLKPTAHITLDSTVLSANAMAAIEAKLYGSQTEEPSLLLPADIATLVTASN